MPDQKKSTVLVADDHEVVVEGVRSALRNHSEFEMIGKASDGPETVEKTKALQPDILILDISMPGMSGVDVAYRAQEASPRTRVVVFSMHGEKEFILSLFRAGIAGYVLKDETIDALVNALETVRDGGTYYSSAVNRVLHEHMLELELGEGKEARKTQNGIARLSSREKEIFPLLADGMTVKEIANRLCISPKTVETHKYNIFDKLNARSIADLTKIGIRKGLVKI